MNFTNVATITLLAAVGKSELLAYNSLAKVLLFLNATTPQVVVSHISLSFKLDGVLWMVPIPALNSLLVLSGDIQCKSHELFDTPTNNR